MGALAGRVAAGGSGMWRRAGRVGSEGLSRTERKPFGAE